MFRLWRKLFEYKTTRTPAFATMVSLVLHGALILLYFWPWHMPQKNETRKLQVELFGMIADRQVQQRARMSEPAPAPEKVEPVKSSPKPPRPPVKQSKPVVQEDSPVEAAPMEKPAENSAQAVAATSGDAPEQQKQETVDLHDTEINALKRYIGRLQRKIKTNLVYPDELKQNAYEGDPAIQFTLTTDGTILPGSLKITQSSGRAKLDANALKAAQASAPFEKPPRQLTIGFVLTFGLRN